MTGDPMLVAAFGSRLIFAVVLFRLPLPAPSGSSAACPSQKNRIQRHALRGITGVGSNAPSVVISVGVALAMLVVVLVLEVNLRNEYLGASVFDAPTFVASDLFADEVDALRDMQAQDSDITVFNATPMLRGALVSVNGTPANQLRTRGAEASFLLSGEVPLTYRSVLPASSRVVDGRWCRPTRYAGPRSSRCTRTCAPASASISATLITFSIFGDEVTAEVANFRDYSWQGGIDFSRPSRRASSKATLDPARRGHCRPRHRREGRARVGRRLPRCALHRHRRDAGADHRRPWPAALAASLVGGLAVSNGLLVRIGSLATGRKQRQADAVITKMLGAERFEIIAVQVLTYGLLAAFAAILATPLGIALAWSLTRILLDVEFTLNPVTLTAVDLGAVAITGFLGAATIFRVLRIRAAHLLREP